MFFARPKMAENGKHLAIGTNAAPASIAELFHSAQSVLAEVVDFVTQKTKARLIYHSEGLEGLIAENDEEMERVTEFIERSANESSEVQLPAQHGLSAVLPRRLPQRRGSGRAGAPDRHPARKHFRRRRSSQRYLDAGWKVCRDAVLSGERDRRSQRCGPRPAVMSRKKRTAPACTRR